MTSKLRCAVYTRKSTEEGLEQDFNSLDAQREACEAYIKSQQHEGWKLLPGRYDDGGISGGTMERPALQRLLNEVRTGRVDIIVVYKVDRLTRALSDFAKMVELFDEHEASFVSVTQQFNTTSSMGRLTLNVLLSFAQFEREVTAERIRDKIAASKKRGMWMGGLVPLGYDSVDKKLVANEVEAETVRTLFQLYLQLGNVRQLKSEADRLDLRSKMRAFKDGRQSGGGRFTRGHLYRLLSNPVYIGEVTHKKERYDGAHEAIIDRDTWDAVQEQLKNSAVNRRNGTNSKSVSLLSGVLWDDLGNRLTPSHATKSKRRYRYYVSIDKEGNPVPSAWRLPAAEIETVALNGLASFLSDRSKLKNSLCLSGYSPSALRKFFDETSELAKRLIHGSNSEKKSVLQSLVQRIDVKAGTICIAVHTNTLLHQSDDDQFTINLPFELRRRAHGEKLIISTHVASAPNPDQKLIKAIALGHGWFKQMIDGSDASIGDLAVRDGVRRDEAGLIFRLAFLAPDIVEGILEGRQPRELSLKRLKRMTPLPHLWEEQRKVLRFAA